MPPVTVVVPPVAVLPLAIVVPPVVCVVSPVRPSSCCLLLSPCCPAIVVPPVAVVVPPVSHPIQVEEGLHESELVLGAQLGLGLAHPRKTRQAHRGSRTGGRDLPCSRTRSRSTRRTPPFPPTRRRVPAVPFVDVPQ